MNNFIKYGAGMALSALLVVGCNKPATKGDGAAAKSEDNAAWCAKHKDAAQKPDGYATKCAPKPAAPAGIEGTDADKLAAFCKDDANNTSTDKAIKAKYTDKCDGKGGVKAHSEPSPDAGVTDPQAAAKAAEKAAAEAAKTKAAKAAQAAAAEAAAAEAAKNKAAADAAELATFCGDNANKTSTNEATRTKYDAHCDGNGGVKAKVESKEEASTASNETVDKTKGQEDQGTTNDKIMGQNQPLI